MRPCPSVWRRRAGGDFHVGKAEAGLPRAADAGLGAVGLVDLGALHVGRHDEGGDAVAFLARLGIGVAVLGHHGVETGVGARGAPLLLAVEHVDLLLFVPVARRLLACGVAADLRLAEREGGKLLTGHHGQELVLLLLGAEEHQRLAADGLVRADHDGRGAAIAAEHFEHAVVAGHAEPHAAVLLGNSHAEHAHVEEALDGPLRNVLLGVDLHARVLIFHVRL